MYYYYYYYNYYSRRFATATARTASLGSHSRGMIQGRSGKWSGGVEARRALLMAMLLQCVWVKLLFQKMGRNAVA